MEVERSIGYIVNGVLEKKNRKKKRFGGVLFFEAEYLIHIKVVAHTQTQTQIYIHGKQINTIKSKKCN